MADLKPTIQVFFPTGQAEVAVRWDSGQMPSEGQWELAGQECCAIARQLRQVRLDAQLPREKLAAALVPQVAPSSAGTAATDQPQLIEVSAQEDDVPLRYQEDGRMKTVIVKRADGVDQGLTVGGKAVKVVFK